MKSFWLLLLLQSGIWFTNNSFAVQTTAIPIDGSTIYSPSMTVNDFISIDLKNYRTADGRKIKWTQRFVLNGLQKKLERKVQKQKVDGTTLLKDVDGASHPNKRGIVSVILVGVGLLLLFLPGWLFGLGAIFAGAGFILGIIGLSKDEDIILALVGTILGALLVVIYAIELFG